MASWPLSAVVGGTYTVPPSEAILSATEIVLPDNFVIKFDPSIRQISWSADRFSYGRNCLIDLSAPSGKPAAGPGGANRGQPSWGQRGAIGGSGQDGPHGLDSIAMSFIINQIDGSAGSLWIRCDGEPGGDGGPGGKGGNGGGSACGTGGGGQHTNAGDGGNGGRGGNGGTGGSTAQVSIRIASVTGGLIRTAGQSPSWPSPPPSGFPETLGTMFVFGAPGPAGAGGHGGAPGEGQPGRDCHWGPFGPANVGGSLNGSPGGSGSPGQSGKYTPATFSQLQPSAVPVAAAVSAAEVAVASAVSPAVAVLPNLVK
jgi:hypothetical protein